MCEYIQMFDLRVYNSMQYCLDDLWEMFFLRRVLINSFLSIVSNRMPLPTEKLPLEPVTTESPILIETSDQSKNTPFL